MMSPKKALVVGALLSAPLFGCDDTGTEPRGLSDEVILAEAALVAADGMFQDLSLAQDPGLQSMGFGGMATGPGLAGPMGGQGCQGQHGVFNCSNMVREGFTFTREVTFYDAGGNLQPEGFDPASTNEIHLTSAASGSVERSFWTATIDRNRNMIITGLLGDAHTLNGTGSGHVYRSGNPAEGMQKTFDMSTSATWTDVVHLQPREENPYPASGTVLRDISVTVTENGEVIQSRTVSTLITFNGTRYVTMTVGDETYEIDLDDRGVNRRFGNGGANG